MSGDRRTAVRERIERLSDRGRQVLTEALSVDGPRARLTLTAYLELEHGAAAPSEADLRSQLAEHLPPHMVPQRFIVLERLPRTAAGKLDRRALERVRGAGLESPPRAAVAPRSPAEHTLAAIWREVLRIDAVGVDDDFFEVGGDSLLSIRLLSRARRAGLVVPVERFFERPTIAGMAVAAQGDSSGSTTAEAAARAAARVPPTGSAPATPIQHWFLDAITDHRDHWNQAVLLELDARADAAVEEVVRQLVTHHDALRLRLTHRDGGWHQEVPPPSAETPLRRVDLGTADGATRARRLEEECEREHRSLRLDRGPLFRAVSFQASGGWRRLVLLAHHLVVDALSWEVILDDCAAMLEQAMRGDPLRLPDKTASAREWALEVARAAARPDVAAAAAYWLGQGEPSRVPRDAELAPGSNTAGDADRVMVALDEPATARVLEAAATAGLQPTAVLLGAMAMAWSEWTGDPRLVLDVEGHGRDALDGVDVSRTVGWFTTVFPLAIEAAAEVADTARAAQSVLGSVPHRGASHGLLRWGSPDESVRSALAARSRSEVLFNYLGVRRTLPEASPIRVATEPTGAARAPDSPRAYVLEVNAYIEDGRLTVLIEYSRRIHNAATIERFADALRGALSALGTDPRPAYSLAPLDAAELTVVAELLAEIDEE